MMRKKEKVITMTVTLILVVIYNLGKPLSDDIDTLSTSLYESIMSESVEGQDYTLSWEYQGITHTVMGNIPYDEIMKIAEGIR